MNYPCPQCSTGIPVVNETAGKAVPCPSCSFSVKLPRLATAKLTLDADEQDGSAQDLSDPDANIAAPDMSVNVSVPVKLSPVEPDSKDPESKPATFEASATFEAVRDVSADRPSESTPLIEDLGQIGGGNEEDVDDDDIPVAVMEEVKEVADSRNGQNGSSSGEETQPLPVARAGAGAGTKAKPARRQPLAKVVQKLRKEVIIPNAVDSLVSEPRLKPGEAGSPGNFTLKEPTAKPAKDLKVRPVLMKAAQAEASREFRGFRKKADDGAIERIAPGEAVPLRVRPRSKIGQLFGRARDFILADPKLRKGAAPEDARDYALKDQYNLQEPTEREASSVDVRPIAKRGNDEVSGFHDVMDRFVPLHEFEEMEGFGEMSREEQEAILQAQAEVEQVRVSSTNKRMFFSGLVFAAPAVVAVTILGWHALKTEEPAPVGGDIESDFQAAPSPQMYSVSNAKSLARQIDTASTIEELAGFTRKPQVSLPRMRRYYETVAFRPNRLLELHPGGGGEIDVPGEGFLWIMATTDDFKNRMLAFEKTNQGLRFDWESYVNYSEVLWTDFVDQQHARHSDFRVTLSKDDYYNFAFADEEKYLCYRLTDPENQRTCYGYTPRVSQVAGILEGMLGLLRLQAKEEGVPVDRASVKVILTLRFPAQTPDAGQAIISDVVCGGWVQP